MSEQETQPGTSSAETQNTDTAEHMIPKSRFDEVNNTLKALQEAQAKREAAERAAADKAAAERGEWERLAKEKTAELERIASEHTTAAERATAYATAMEAQIKSRMKALPEELRDLLPESADVLTRYEQLAKLEAAAAKLTSAPPAPRGTPPGAGTRATASSAQSLADIIAEKRARIGGL